MKPPCPPVPGRKNHLFGEQNYTASQSATEIDLITVSDLPETALETVTYAYTDDNWKDKLTEFNGSYITYDEIGNPTSDGEWLYAWEKGRQLKAQSRATETVVYEYNASGLRVKKIATSTGTTHYTLHGKNIVHLPQGNDALHFYYDASDKPALVEYNGTMYAHALESGIQFQFSL